MDDLAAVAEDAPPASPLHVDGDAVKQVYMDPLWRLGIQYWQVCIKKRDEYLLAVYQRCDDDHNGVLDLTEFKHVVASIDARRADLTVPEGFVSDRDT